MLKNMSKNFEARRKITTFAVPKRLPPSVSKTFRDSDIYRERLTERDLVRDFPADESFINALHRMQAYFYAQKSTYDIPVVRVMNNAHFVLNYMMNLDCTDQMEYDTIVYRNSGKDKQLAMITTITLIAMLEYTESARARTCRSVMTEDRSEEFYEGLSLYKKWLENPTDHFSEEDFHIDLMDEINALRVQNAQLTYEYNQLQKQYRIMENQYNQQNNNCTVYNAPVTINNNYYPSVKEEPEDVQASDSKKDQATDLIPEENDYRALVRWLEHEKERGNDHYADAGFNRSKMCRNLLKIIGWWPNQDSLRKAQMRN